MGGTKKVQAGGQEPKNALLLSLCCKTSHDKLITIWQDYDKQGKILKSAGILAISLNSASDLFYCLPWLNIIETNFKIWKQYIGYCASPWGHFHKIHF